MRRILIPILLLSLNIASLFAQQGEVMQPHPLQTGEIRPGDPTTPRTGADAGTAIPALFASAQSSDVQYLCMGDSMSITHVGGSLAGDPIPATPPGFTYVFYDCPPSISGANWMSILNDPCHIIDPNTFSPPGITTVQSFITPDGNATFFNNGSIQAAFGSGAPFEVFFAPITVDDFANFDPEPDPGTNELGPCMDVNTAGGFSVVYLNEILTSNFVNNGCFGELTISGGLPEWDGGEVYNVTVVNNADPTITGQKINTTALSHNTSLIFSVPVAGIYTISIDDDVSCPQTFVANMSGCVPPMIDIAEETAMPNEMNVCVDFVLEDFVDINAMDFIIQYDPAVITFQNASFASGPNLTFASPLSPGQIAVLWGSSVSNLTFPDGDVVLELCFDVIGAAGSSSAISVVSGMAGVNDPTYGSNLNGIDLRNDLIVLAGSISVLGGPLTVDFTSCSTQNGPTPTGSFSFTVMGGTPPYNYTFVNTMNAAINGSGTIAMINQLTTENGLPPGTYSVTIMDSGASMEVTTVTIADAPTLTPLPVGTSPVCQGEATGSILLNQGNFTNMGGVSPYMIDWSTGPGDMNAVMLNNLTSGVYMATVTDANGCSQLATQAIVDPLLLTIDETIVQLSCTGNGMDGSINVQAVGGVGPNYDYAWSNGPNTQLIDNLGPGNYCVTVTDQGGCMMIECYDIMLSNPPTLSFTETPLGCPGDMNGSIMVNVVPGDGNITSIEWEDGTMGALISNLGAGTYTVSVNDDASCEIVDSFTLVEPPGLFISNITVTSPVCATNIDGQIAVTASGGTMNYSYSWSSGGNQSAEFGLECGEFYTVLVSDGGSCPPIDSMIFIPCPPDISISTSNILPVDCNGGIPCDGSATVSPSGGTSATGNYFYQWDNGTNQSNLPQSDINNLCQGINTVSVTDQEGCEFVFTVDIPAPPPLLLDQATTTITPVSCFDGMDGEVIAMGQGGIGPYSYSWAGGPNVSTFSNLSQGNYSLTIVDQNLCEFAVTIPVNQPDELIPFVVADNTTDPSCFEEEDGVIEIAWNGGNLGPTTFAWNGSSSTSTIANNLAAGIYSVTVTDSKNCTGVLDTFLTEPPPISFTTPDILEPECNGETAIVMLTDVMGGTGTEYTFSVGMSTRRPITQPINVQAGDNISIQVFDENGCSEESFIDINEPSPIIVEFGADIQEIDLGEDIVLAPIIDADLGIDSLIWSPQTDIICVDTLLNIFECEDVLVNPFETTTYTLTVLDVNGCEAVDEILIEVNKKRNVYIPNAFSPDDSGRNDFFEINIGNGVSAIESARVFDRWGEVMVESTEIELLGNQVQIWDGYFRGKLMNPGVYVYLIEVRFVDGVSFTFRGDVTLIR